MKPPTRLVNFIRTFLKVSAFTCCLIFTAWLVHQSAIADDHKVLWAAAAIAAACLLGTLIMSDEIDL